MTRLFGSFRNRAIAFITVAGLWGFVADAVELVRDGKPVAVIVVPRQPSKVESYAAKELQYHIQCATGAQLPIAPEGGKATLDGMGTPAGRVKDVPGAGLPG